MQELISRTTILLEELHECLFDPIKNNLTLNKPNLIIRGTDFKEPIFYSAESAFNFQYLEFGLSKFKKDNDWLKQNKGFYIEDANKILKAIFEIQNLNLKRAIEKLFDCHFNDITILSGFIFTLEDIVQKANLEKDIVINVLKAFTYPYDYQNNAFNTLSDFNMINAFPILQLEGKNYLLFQQYCLAEAFYDSPFYWMNKDKSYIDTAMRHRGEFTENVCAEMFKRVFGKKSVWSNVNIVGPSNNVIGEIDVLAVFADRAIILQAKSKKLTLESRKGNDNALRNDFIKSVQNSYDQGLSCSKYILNRANKLIDDQNKEIIISRNFTELYIMCSVSDHYPSLYSQVRQYLNCETTDIIMPPFITDIFLIDTLTEILNTPLRLLSYINRRTNYFERIYASNELAILGYHLNSNLWIEGQTRLILDDSCTIDINAAMIVRREGLLGRKYPLGILEKYENTFYEELINEIETLEKSETINLGFLLLKLKDQSINTLNKAIKKIIQFAQCDGIFHDLSIPFNYLNAGLTIHINEEKCCKGLVTLKQHCDQKKYLEHADSWFGICIDKNTFKVKYGVETTYKWEYSEELELIYNGYPRKKLLKMINPESEQPIYEKVGRNDRCPCGSGKKYKICCGR